MESKNKGVSDQERLIFIYNANSGIRNKIFDSAHKIFSPDTYACNLCDITYGVFSEKKAWKEFREKSLLQMEFLHKDEFKALYASKFGYKFNFPVVLIGSKGGFEVLVAKDELDKLESPEGLMRLITGRI
ncbi:GTPase [Maribacter sp. ANRC-HE7]|uniref:GTPase n=1 Tax=Maribacter aquimaris TaxID=2737171 RepID=A0ABR7V3M2_9FLAO|nr:GTPase [Maribacter aquimaris]